MQEVGTCIRQNKYAKKQQEYLQLQTMHASSRLKPEKNTENSAEHEECRMNMRKWTSYTVIRNAEQWISRPDRKALRTA